MASVPVPSLLDHPAPRAACPARRRPLGRPTPPGGAAATALTWGPGFWRPREEEGEENLRKNAGARGVSRWASLSGRKTKTSPGRPSQFPVLDSLCRDNLALSNFPESPLRRGPAQLLAPRAQGPWRNAAAHAPRPPRVDIRREASGLGVQRQPHALPTPGARALFRSFEWQDGCG